MLTVTGILKTPAGQALAHATVRFYALETSTNVLKGSTGEFTTDASGAYSVDLEQGYHRAQLQLPQTRPEWIGNIHVVAGTVANTLNDLLMASEMARTGTPLADAVLSTLATAEAVRDESTQILQATQAAESTATQAAQGAVASGEQAAQALSDLNAQTAVEPGANKIPRADAQGKIDPDWLTYELPAILQAKAVTAVDVFVYDTSLDSDGGEWRNHTQTTSWYNEPLNTATRGARKEFPAVAVIVAETDKVTIYDGDDPSLPMWVVLFAGYTDWISPSSISMVNGVLVIGSNKSDSRSGLWILSFPKDLGGWQWGSSAYLTYGGIGTRVNVYPYGLDVTSVSIPVLFNSLAEFGDDLIVNKYVHDVAIAVLPDAPVDPSTGLQIPTIAVATDGGVSVIKDDGSVVNITNIPGHVSVKFIGDRMWLGRKGIDLVEFGHIPDITAASDIWRDGYYSTKAYPAEALAILAGTGKNLLADYTIAGTGGVALIAEKPSSPSDGMVTHIASNYNTGWMHGDCKLAALCDTETGDTSAPELVTNGTFDTDLTGWNVGSGWVWEAGAAKSNASYAGYLTQSPFNKIGALYEVTFSNVGISGGAVYINTGSGYITQLGVLPLSGDFTFYHKCTSITDLLAFAGATGYAVDNISVKEVTPDRSGNDNNLNIIGTLNRQLIGNGGLPIWGGFDGYASLAAPTNMDLDIGRGDFWVGVWTKVSGTSYSEICKYLDLSGTNKQGFLLFQRGSNGGPANCVDFRLIDSDNATVILNEANANLDDKLYKVDALRRGGVLHLFVNGVLVKSAACDFDITNPSARLRLGGVGASLMMMRLSLGSPSNEQIDKMYSDELAMIQGKATLHGTSDAVTALAHDPVTDLLHVGTSDGRSVFKGLTRVDNTTDPVIGSISAVNSMVVED